MRRLIYVLLAGVLASVGCGGAASAPGMTVRDSAGVRIVEYADVPPQAQPMSLSTEPIFRHGHRTGDHLFARIGHGVLLPDGGAVVSDAGAGPGAGQTVLLFSAAGRLRAVLARAGQGPSEVRQLVAITLLAPDTVLVEDRGNRKLMLFSDTVLARIVSTASSPGLGGLRIIGADESGQPLMTTSSFRTDFTVPWWPGQLARLDRETLLADTVAAYDLAPSRGPDGQWNPMGPFGSVVVSAGQFVHARTDIATVVWRGPDGALRQILRWNPVLRYPTEDDKQRFRESLASDLQRVNPTMSPERLDQFLKEQLARMEIRDDVALPLFRDLLGDGSGGVWLSEFTPIVGVSFSPRYTAVASDGAWLGTVEVPERFRVLDVSGHRVLGVLVDELGVESVAVFELRRG